MLRSRATNSTNLEPTLQDMTIFEYIMVMVSIILALALAQLLRAVAELLTSARRYWVHMVWVISLVLIVVQFWWAYWDFNAVETWTFDTYLAVLLAPTFIFLQANLLAPTNRGPNWDWKAHFNSVSVWFFGIFVLMTLTGIVVSVIYLNAPVLHPYRGFQFVLLGLACVGLAVKSDKAQGTLAVTFLSVFLISQAVVRMNLGALAMA